MRYEDVLKACDAGKKVFWHHEDYKVIKDRLGQYLVIYTPNQYTTGLAKSDAKDCYVEGSA